MNRLSNFKFIPNSSVQEIAEEYIMNTRKSLESRKSLLKKSLDGLANISQEEKDKILSELENKLGLSWAKLNSSLANYASCFQLDCFLTLRSSSIEVVFN